MMSSLVWTYFRTIFVIIQESKSTDRIYQTYMGGIYRESKMDIQMWSRAQGPGRCCGLRLCLAIHESATLLVFALGLVFFNSYKGTLATGVL